LVGFSALELSAAASAEITRRRYQQQHAGNATFGINTDSLGLGITK
jgi:hypothetical protein